MPNKEYEKDVNYYNMIQRLALDHTQFLPKSTVYIGDSPTVIYVVLFL